MRRIERLLVLGRSGATDQRFSTGRSVKQGSLPNPRQPRCCLTKATALGVQSPDALSYGALKGNAPRDNYEGANRRFKGPARPGRGPANCRYTPRAKFGFLPAAAERN